MAKVERWSEDDRMLERVNVEDSKVNQQVAIFKTRRDTVYITVNRIVVHHAYGDKWHER